jgi:hypothetical protein
VIASELKRLALMPVFGRWRRPSPSVDGYTILLPSPMDMPFLLRFALEGLRQMDTSYCRQIIVIPDGYGADGGAAIQRVVDSCGDSRVELARLRAAAHFVVKGMRRSSLDMAVWTYWAMIIEGINRAKCEYIFLHDADAFCLESGGLERQYRACRDRGMATLGVAARWDPFFREIGYKIPGTYELMFSAQWARRHRPLDLRGGRKQTTHGLRLFDVMLYPQFQEYPSGKIGVLDPPLRLVHFAGAIITYRMFCGRVSPSVTDDGFRLLFLALMEDVVPSPSGDRLLPSINELAQGLDDTSARVNYCSPRATREYPVFRAMIEDLCNSQIFLGPRAKRIRTLIYPFDMHYENRLGANNLRVDGWPDGIIPELSVLGPELADKWFQLLTEIVPGLARLAVLSNPSNASHVQALEQMQTAARSRGVELNVAHASAPDKFEPAFATVIGGRADALVVLADGMFFNEYSRILAFTDMSRLPALFPNKQIAEAGGLIAYGPNIPPAARRADMDKVLPSETAADLPVDLSTKFELAINLRTARSLGITVPPRWLAIADEVIA